MVCPHCHKRIDDELIKTEGARLMVGSRADRKRPKDKNAAARAKIREMMEQLQKLKDEYGESESRNTKRATTAKSA